LIGIIPAAGKGLRFKELGKQYSKTILPYKEKPIIIHQIEWLMNNGCTDIRVVINHQEDIVKEIVSFYGKSVSFFRQENQNGLSGAILSALENEKSEDSILILLGDLVITEDNIIREPNKTKNFISVKEVPDYSRWCMFDDKTKQFIDKPQEKPDTNLAVSGVYHLLNAKLIRKLIQKQIKDNNKIAGEFQISTILQEISSVQGMDYIKLDMIDFGTLEEYLENRSVKNSRSFNDIREDGSFIIKSSIKEREKIIKEYNWFINLPDDIKIFTPRIFSKDFYSNRTFYKMEKILAPSLREIYLFLDSTEETWNTIFDSLFDTLEALSKYGQPNSFMDSIVNKTKDRVKNIEIPIENKIVNDFIIRLEKDIGKFSRSSLMHGDFCFSNLLYDFQGSKIKMIDPRGELFGDHYYEIAKIFHSVLYDYDFIDAELYIQKDNEYKIYNNGKNDIKALFISKIEEIYSEEEIEYIKLITASLFLSMIPLHGHNTSNQKMYYNKFKEIYKEIYKEIS